MSDGGAFSIRFWGVRGSIACAGPKTVRYGGNTTSFEIQCGDSVVLVDAGTGIRELGQKLSEQGSLNLDILLTHTHFDHINGIPFFEPFFNPETRCRLWTGHLGPGQTSHQVISDMMVDPLFPVPLGIFKAEIEFNDFAAGDTLELPSGVGVRTAPLNHPNGATGYRVEHGGKSICVVTDTEHEPGQPDDNVLGLIEGADIVVYDCTYTDAEFEARRGWGHSTWQEGVRLCEAAGAKTLVVFHHDPDHDDVFMDGVAGEVEAARPGSLVAREGMVLTP